MKTRAVIIQGRTTVAESVVLGIEQSIYLAVQAAGWTGDDIVGSPQVMLNEPNEDGAWINWTAILMVKEWG